MRNLIKIFLLMIVVLLGSCKKFLELEPLAQISASQFYKSKFDVDAAMAGMYSAFQLTMVGESQFQDRYHYWGEFRSDNFHRSLSYNNQSVNELAFNSITPDNAYTDWTPLYNVVSKANNNIKYIPGVPELDNLVTEDMVNTSLAQSYAMRAMAYFYIVRMWGDAPIWTEPFETLAENAEKPRESADKIIDEVIIKDLERAYELTTKNQTNVIWYLGEGAICAALADVYMWKKDYPNAIIWFKNLFKAKGPTGAVYGGLSEANLQPTATWKSIFTAPASSIESIWSIHWDYATNGCPCTQLSYSTSNKHFVVEPTFHASYFSLYSQPANDGDIRPKQTIDVYYTGGGIESQTRFLKFLSSPVNPTAALTTAQLTAAGFVATTPVYLPMYRLTDMYLLYAEALNGNDDLVNALKYLNFVRKRANVAQYLAADAAVSTKEAMEDAILNERQKELIGEGKRWFDLVRTEKVDQVMDPVLIDRQTAAGNIEPSGFEDLRRVLWPISRNVLNANKKLIQNSAYTD